MEKKVGKVIIIFLLVSNYIFASESSIILRMQDMSHKPIDQAMCQAPFILQVELKNLDVYTDLHLMQYITGIENFKTSRSMTSHNVSIDNGKKTTKFFYNFILRSDKKGKFTVGPFNLQDKSGTRIQSNRLIIPVGDEIVLSEKSEKDKYFVTTSFDKKQAYVGEKLTLSVKFYDRLFVDDLHLQFPEFKNLYIVKNQQNVTKSMVVLDGEEYSVTQWLFDMYATEPGLLMIQDIHAVFFAPELESKFTFGGAFDFFRSLHKSEQHIVSQPIKADIIPLPIHHDHVKVNAVGQFSKFVISINQNSAPVGQGIVLTAQLFGEGNFEMIPLVPLVLPEGFKYYDSNLVTIDENRKCKQGDFIVQADTPGSYRIAPQSLIYFDVVAAQYKQIQSNALDITIIPAVQESQDVSNLDGVLDTLTQDDESLPKELQDFSVVEKGSIHARSHIMIPLCQYQQLIWLLCLIWFLSIIYSVALEKYIFKHPAWDKFILFYRADKTCKQASRKKDFNTLHVLFIKIFTYLTNVHVGQLKDSDMIQYLKDKNFTDEQIQAWKRFYQKVLQSSFASKNQLYQEDLFQQSLQWIQQLKEKA